MTHLRRIRPSSLGLSLVLTLLVLGMAPAPGSPVPDRTDPVEVVGSGPDSLVCIACIAGGVAVVSGGISTVVVAAAARGSAIAALTCALACANALS